MSTRTVAVTAALLALASSAAAQSAAPATAAAPVCTPAQVPTAAKPVKPKDPALPKCVNEKARTHTCRHGEIDKYNVEVERQSKQYRLEFDAYMDALQKYVDEANAYARCEMKSLDVVLSGA